MTLPSDVWIVFMLSGGGHVPLRMSRPDAERIVQEWTRWRQTGDKAYDQTPMLAGKDFGIVTASILAIYCYPYQASAAERIANAHEQMIGKMDQGEEWREGE